MKNKELRLVQVHFGETLLRSSDAKFREMLFVIRNLNTGNP